MQGLAGTDRQAGGYEGARTPSAVACLARGVVGALATWVATFSAEHAKWRRDQSVRWDEKRLTVYTEYSHAVKQMISAATRLQDQRSDAEPGTAPPEAQAVVAA